MPRRAEIVDSVREKILQNEFGPGESVPEESLAAEFSVSRTPVREALIVLEHQGLVVNEANRGVRVVSVSIESIRSYFETARATHPVMFGLVNSRISDADRKLLVSERPATANPTSSVLDHFRFLVRIAALSRNDFMLITTRAIEAYHCFVRASVLRNLPERVVGAACDELRLHRENVVDAIMIGDDAELTEALSQMIEGSRVFLISHLV